MARGIPVHFVNTCIHFRCQIFVVAAKDRLRDPLRAPILPILGNATGIGEHLEGAASADHYCCRRSPSSPNELPSAQQLDASVEISAKILRVNLTIVPPLVLEVDYFSSR